MKITSDRWQILSSAIVLVGMSYFAAEAFSRGAIRDLIWGSLLLWNAIWLIPSYWWWWPRRQAVQAAMGKPPAHSRIRVLSAVLASGVALGASPMVVAHMLEQNSLGLQVLGGLLLAIVSLVAPGWALWSYRWARRRMNAAAV